MYQYPEMRYELDPDRLSENFDLQLQYGLELEHKKAHLSLFLPNDYDGPYNRPLRMPYQEINTSVQDNQEKYQIYLDVQHFKPEELTVKLVNNCVVVEGKHEENLDEHGYIQRQFTRRCMLPEGHDIDAVYSVLSTDGILTVSVPKCEPRLYGERVIPIHKSGPHSLFQQNKPMQTEGRE